LLFFDADPWTNCQLVPWEGKVEFKCCSAQFPVSFPDLKVMRIDKEQTGRGRARLVPLTESTFWRHRKKEAGAELTGNRPIKWAAVPLKQQHEQFEEEKAA